MAVDGTDFTGVASVVIPAGQTSTTFTIATLDDNLAEGAEKFTVAINPSSLGAVGGLEDVRVSTVNNSVETTITDETVPTTPDAQTALVSITGPADVIEGDTTTPYTVSISQAPVTDLTVTFTYSGVAVDGTDFTGVASVVIPAGQTSTTFTIATLDDNLAEGAEKFTVAINPSSLGAVGGLEDVRVSTVNNSVETTITDETVPTTPDAQTALVSITGPADVIEGDTTTPYTVSISQAPVTDLTVTFTYSGVAVDGTDFTGVASVVIPAGQTSTTFTIATLDDNLAEGAEKFTVAINPSSLGAVGGLEDVRVSTVNNSVETTITDETVPTTPDAQTALVSITGPADVIEGDTTTPYTVSISQAPVTDLTVTFTYSGVAVDGTDFTGVASVVIPAGQTSTTFTIATLDDNLAEGAEKFTVAINPSSLGAVGGLEDVRVSTVNNSVETTITDETVPTTPDAQTALVSITGPADVIEGDTTTPYTVSISQAPVTDLTVTFTYSGVAVDGTDFTGVASVVIPAGQTSTTFTIATLDDNLAEGAEKFTVAINPSSLGAVGGLEDVRVSTVNNSVETTITDETVPTTPDAQTALVSITGPADVIEGDTTTPYTVSISQAPVTDLTVTFTYSGVAVDGTDFTGVASVVIPAGQTSTTFTIATLDDNLAEGAEKFTVAINPSSLGAVGGLEDVRVSTVNNSVETTITDETVPTTPDAQTALVSITGPADVIEGDTTTPYTVSISQAPVTDLTVTFTYSGVAVDGTDFTGVASVVIPAGQTSTTFTIATLDDNLAEGAEKFTVAINPSSLGAVGGLEDVRVSTVNNSVETTITDETVPTTPDAQTALVSITGPADVIEGDTTTPYTVSISQAPVTDLTVTFTYSGVAVDGTDFTGVASVVIPAGQTSTTFTIATLDDNLAEGAEKFTVAINPSSLGAVGGLEDVRVSTVNNSVETTITDETVPTTPDAQTALVSITGPADVIEGDTTTPYTVSISQAPVTDLTVTFTYSGVAVDGTDFTGVASVVIPAGQTSTTFTIATLDDNLAEGAEKFTVAINPSSLGAVGGLEDVRVSTVNNSVETTITDETVPTTPDAQTALVSITGPADVIEGDTTTPYTVSISQAPVTDLTVTFTYSGVAVDGTDFTGVASVVIPAGQTSTTFTIATLDDNLAEGAEKFTVAINPSSLGAVGGLEDVRVSTVNNSVETTITDETVPTTPDAQTALVSITGPADVIEGDTTTPYTVSISQAPVTDLTVTFTYSGVAVDGTDFTGVASVVIPAGQTSTTFTIATLDDNLAEGAEKFTVAINPSSLGAVGGLEDVRVSTVNNSVETTITDETVPTTPDAQTALVSITGPADVIEGDTTTPYTVSISQAPVTDLTVTFTYSGVAVDGTDFTGVASVVIPAGQTSTTFTIATLDDNLAEGAEKFTVAINPSSLGAVGGLEDVRVSTVNNSVETTITDETVPTTPDAQTALVSITGPADVIEGDTTTPYTVSISQAPVTDLTVTFTYSGVAVDGTDFTGVASVVIPAGQTSTTFTIATLDDNLAEGAEKFTVAINPSSLGAVGGLEDVRVSTVNNSVETTITDETVPTTPDAQTALVSITGPADVIEGDTTTPYTVSISQAPVTDLTVTFTYSGVAVDGTDFTGVASVVIPAGQTSTTFTIATLDDNLAEGAEKFTVAINPSSLGAVGGLEDVRVSTVNNSVETTITDETVPTTPDAQTALVSITGPADVIEGDTTTPYTVSISQAPVTDLTVTFTYSGVAVDGTDFTGVASVVIPAGQTSTTFTIATLDDNLAEGAEKFTVAINPSSLGAVGGLEDVRVSTVNNSVETTITDETVPTTPDAQTALVSITGPADVIEGDTTTPYTVSISQAPVTDLTVTFTYSGVAVDGTDFTGVASVVIPAGQTSTTFTIATLDDNLAEGAEKFTVAINPSSLGAVGGLEDVRVSTVNNSVETTITDETVPTTPDAQTALVSITGPADVIEGDTTTPYTVSISQAPVTDLTVTFTYSGVAVDGTDFTGVASVVIPAGQTSTTFTIATLDDNLAEGAEKFTVAINPSSLGAVGGLEDVRVSTVNNSVETTITDETVPTTPDAQTALVSITGPADVIEGDTTTPYTVSISQAPVTDLTVTFTYSGVAVDGTDFTGVASVVIPAGQTSTTFTIATLDDNLAEGAEKFTVAINPSSLGAVGGLEDVRVSTVNNSVETTITDETVPTTPDAQTALVSITGPADVIEGDTTTPYTVSISQAPVTDLTVTFTYSGVAVDGTDFTGVASVVIPAGQTSTTFTIATLDDNLAEGAEKFTVAINPSSLGAVGGLEDVRVSTVNNSVETTITDETVPTTPDAQTALVSITGPADVIEGDTTTPYTVSISQAPVTDLTVTFTYSGVAVDGTDFTGVASVVIPAGQTSTTFTIATLDDNLAEGAEKFTVAINPSSLGAVGGLEDVRVSTVNNSVETTITDETVPTTPDAQTALVSITGPADVIEGDTTTPYTVSISQAPVTDLTVTFTYSGVAVDGTDFTGVASVVIPAGQTSTTFTIATLDDNLAEGAEKFTVAINPSSLGAVGGLEDVRVSTVNNSVETTITDETVPTTPDAQTALVSITGPADVIEGDTTTPYTVSISQAPVTDLTVTFTYSGVAVDGTDFTGVASVVIPAGQTSTTFTIATLDDNLAEGAEKFTVAINPSSLGAVGGLEDVRVSTVNNSVETTITDETVPTTPDAQTALVSITGPADVIEGDTTTPYTVSISQAPVTDLTVTFTYSGVAVDGTDFTGVASVVIPAGQTSTTFTIATLDDNLAEGAEKFTVAINPSSLGAVGGLEDVRVSTVNNSVETTITDETVPTTPDAQTALVSITGPADVIEGDTTTPYTVSISQAPVTDLTVTFTYSGVAVDGTDFTGVASVVIPAGQTSTTFTIATLDDNLAEGAEKFTVAINPSSLGAVGGLEDVRVSTVNNSVETTITDETVPTTPDAQTALVSITGPADVIEGDTTTPYTVSISQAPVTDLTVTFTYSGVAVDGTDFTGVASVVIPAGQTSTTFTIATLDDNLAEGAEKFTVAINPSSLGAVGGLEDVRVSTVNNSVETTITDETVPTTPDAQTALVSITGPADVIEGDTTTPYTVSISQAPVTDLTVTFTYSGVAVDGTDFTGVASVVIPAGQTSTTFTIATLDDNLAEGAEKFTVAINPSSLGAVGGLEDVRVSTVNNSVETTITDETVPTTPDAQTALVSITGPADVIEGDTTTPYTVSISQAPVTDLTVTFTYSGVAVDGTDFTGVASVVIPAGQTSTTFTIATLDDNLAEGAEKFTVAINPSSLGAVGGLEDVRVSTVNNSVETTITDETVPTTPDAQTALVSITGPADVIEGDTTTPYTVSISQAPVTDLTVTFTYSGVAVDGTDFTGVASVVIPAGQTSTTFTIATLDDNLAEGAEKFTVAINPSSLGAVGGLEDVRVSTVNNSVETTITDETVPTTPDAQTALVSITGPADVIEGDTTTPYTVSISQAPVTDLTVTFTYSGVAVDGTDFTGVASVVIPAGQTSTTFTIATLDDNLAEGAEKFTVAINPSSLGAVGGLEDVRVSTVNNSVETTITDETVPTTPDAQTALVSITGPADVIEGDTTTPYTVSISQAPVTDLTVTFTYSGVAVDGTDFTGVASVVIPAGQTSTTFTIATLDDNLAEGAEKFTVAINPSSLGAVGGLEDVRVSTVNNSVETTITDETVPTTPDAQTALVSITGPADVIEGDTTTPYTVSISQAPVTDLTVTFTYSGVAVDGTDFTGVASVVIPAGQTSTTFTIATLDDNLAEGAEKFTVAINPSSLGAVGGLEDVRVSTVNNSVETTITDETVPTTPDAQTALVSITGPADVIEGDTTTPYTVSISQAPVTDLTVTFTYSGVAVDGTDFTGVASVVIPAGQTSTTFTIATLDDNLAEGAEKFTVAINPSSLGAVGGLEDVRVSTVNNSVETTITDETVPTTPDAQTALVSITGPADVIEGDTTTPYTVSISQAPVTDLTVTFTYSGVAVDGTDFTGVASVVIPAGQTSTTFTIATLDDNLAEGAEKFTVAINPSSLGAVGGLEDVRVSTVNNSVETTITDETVPTTPDAQTALVSITGPADVIEGDTTTPYTVSISQAPVTDLTVTFTYSGVAVDGTDFTGVASVVIPAGQTSTTFTIATLDDNLAEGAEKFTVAINPSSLGAVGGLEDVRVSTVNNSVETTITDETVPTTPDAQTALVSITGPADVIEGDTTTPYTVSISQAPVTDLTVTFTYSGVAVDGTDFTGVASVVIPAGQTSTTFTIATLDDNLAEGAEKFTVAINPSSLGAVGGLEDVRVSTVNNSVETTITDETVPTTPDAQTALVSITGPADVIEGDTTTPYTVSISQAPVTDLTVTFTYSGVAVDGTDFTGVASVVIPAGQTSTTFTIATLDDNLAEGAEKFTVAINPSSLGAVGGLEDVRVSTVNNSVETTITDKQIAPEIESITVNVSEEGLVNGIKDSNGVIDTTDESKISGIINITDANNDSLNVTLTAPTTVLVSNGETVIWSGSNTKELIGKVGTTEVIKVTINDSGEYTVELLQPVTHPINSVEDIVSLNIGVVADDGMFTSTGTIVVNIEDDMPTVENTTVVWSQTTTIPDIFTGNVSFAGNGGIHSQYSFANGAVVVTGKGFTSSTNLDLINASLSQSAGGLGVASSSSPYHNVANEVDFRKTSDGQAVSEELIIKLEDGKISYGAKINFAYMYGGELEVGVAEFYRDGVLVSTQTFSSNASSGNYAANFEVLDGGFDTIIIKATDNGNSFNIKDNSDFAVTGIEFLGTTASHVISYAEGTISYGYGADGAGSLGLTEIKDNLTLTDGSTVTVITTANSIIAKDSNGELVFQVQLTPSTGKWDYYQYKDFLIGDGTKETLDISFKVVDADGDGVDSSILIGVNKLPTSSDDIIEILEDQNHTLTLNDFGDNSTDFTKVKIETLPTNGILLLSGVAVNAGQEINKSDIESGKLVFDPTENTDVDSNFSFKISNGGLWSESYNTEINIIAVADKPTVSIDVEFVKEVSISNVTTTSQDLGNLIAYLNNQGNVSADQVVALIKDQNGNPMQDQYNLELTSLGNADLVLYDNTSNQNATRDINDINLTDTTALTESSLTVVTNTINNTYNMTTNKVLFEGDIIQNGNVIGTSGNDIIIVEGQIQGGSNINAGSGNDLIAILGDIGANQPAIDGGNGIDILYLSKPASHYYFSDIHFHDNLDGHIVDKDTGKTLTFNNIEGIAFGDGSGINSEIITTKYNEYNVDISAALADTDGSETLTVTITNVPTGATLSSDAYTLVDNGNNTWSVTIPAGTKVITDSITMNVPESVNSINLGITARATEANDNSNGLNFAEATANDALLSTTDDIVVTNEDTSKVLSLSDFGTYSNVDGYALSTIKIDTLPTNGVLLFNGVAITAGVVLNASDISSGKLVFTPNSNSDVDSSFTFQVSDGQEWSTIHTTTIEVIAVADKPTANINVERSVTIDASNVTDTSKGYTVTAYNTSGTQTTISTVTGTTHDGFGVTGSSSGDATEIGYNNTTKSSEVLKVAFVNDVSSVDVTFAWKHAGTNPETAVINFYRDGVLVGSQTHTGGTDTVDGPFTLTADNGVAFDEVRFSALGAEDDYLIHDISFTEVATNNSGAIVGEIYNVDISAALADTDGSEALTVKISGVPTGATFDTADMVDKGNGVWELILPAGTKSISDTLKMTVPESAEDFNLTITARATETNDNSNGLNFAEATASDAIVYAVNETNTLTFGKATTNLLFTLDVSGSMSDKVKDSSGVYTTRFEIAKASIITTINAYNANGQTDVNLTLFNSGAKNIGWMSTSTAIAYLNKLTMDSSGNIKYNGSSISGLTSNHTDYYDGLNATMSVNFTGHNATNTVAYFLSDGAPNDNSDKIDQDSDQTIKDWKTYVDTNIDTLYVVGVGAGAQESPLKIVQVQEGDKVIMATDDSTLGNTLLSTVSATITGDVSDNISGGDGTTTIDSIVVDGVEYTKTTFPTDGIAIDGDGKLVFNFETGVYSYSAKSSEFTTDTTKTFEVHASDTNGDSTSFDVNLKMDISPNESVNTLNLSGEDIDLTSIISAHTNTDVINLENSQIDKISVNLNDVLVQEDHQLIIKGDLHDKVDLDTPSDWASAGHEQVDGVNYNVYTGTGANSTIKLLIDDDIDVTPHI